MWKSPWPLLHPIVRWLIAPIEIGKGLLPWRVSGVEVNLYFVRPEPVYDVREALLELGMLEKTTDDLNIKEKKKSIC